MSIPTRQSNKFFDLEKQLLPSLMSEDALKTFKEKLGLKTYNEELKVVINKVEDESKSNEIHDRTVKHQD